MTQQNARPWVAQYAPGVPADIERHRRHAVRHAGRAVARRSATRWRSTSSARTTTYAELGDAGRPGRGGAARARGRAGDRVALILPNCPQHVVAFYAVLRLGRHRRRAQPAVHRGRAARTSSRTTARRWRSCWDKVVPVAGRLPGTHPARRRSSRSTSPRALPLAQARRPAAADRARPGRRAAP